MTSREPLEDQDVYKWVRLRIFSATCVLPLTTHLVGHCKSYMHRASFLQLGVFHSGDSTRFALTLCNSDTHLAVFLFHQGAPPSHTGSPGRADWNPRSPHTCAPGTLMLTATARWEHLMGFQGRSVAWRSSLSPGRPPHLLGARACPAFGLSPLLPTLRLLRALPLILASGGGSARACATWAILPCPGGRDMAQVAPSSSGHKDLRRKAGGVALALSHLAACPGNQDSEVKIEGRRGFFLLQWKMPQTKFETSPQACFQGNSLPWSPC